jgi:hypothetical protein
MKRMISKIILGITALIFLVSTSGFPVFRHSCQTEQTTEFSFLLADFSCDHQHSDDAHPAHPCCETSGTSNNINCGTDHCCDTETLLVKLNTTSYYQNIFKKPVISAIDVAKVEIYEFLSPVKESTHIIISNDLPPPLSGKALLIFLHQLTTPYPSV